MLWSSYLTIALLPVTACAAATPVAEPSPKPEPAKPLPAAAAAPSTHAAITAGAPRADTIEGPGLEPDQIQAVVLARFAAFQGCLGLTTKPNRGPADKLAIAWEVGPDGSVAQSRLVSSTLNEPRVEGCMLRVVNLMKFPAAPRPTKVQFPFAYAAGAAPDETQE